jgi:hypothetical protein
MTYTQELEKALEDLRGKDDSSYIDEWKDSDVKAFTLVLEAARLYLEQLR